MAVTSSQEIVAATVSHMKLFFSHSHLPTQQQTDISKIEGKKMIIKYVIKVSILSTTYILHFDRQLFTLYMDKQQSQHAMLHLSILHLLADLVAQDLVPVDLGTRHRELPT